MFETGSKYLKVNFSKSDGASFYHPETQKVCMRMTVLGNKNDKNLSKKPVNNNVWPVCLIYFEKNSGLYVYSGLYAYKFLGKFSSCMLIWDTRV